MNKFYVSVSAVNICVRKALVAFLREVTVSFHRPFISSVDGEFLLKYPLQSLFQLLLTLLSHLILSLLISPLFIPKSLSAL